MDKNNRTNIFQILKISFLLGFVLAGFFGFGLFVQAAGSVTFSSVKVSSPNVTDGQTLRVTPILSYKQVDQSASIYNNHDRFPSLK